MLQQIWQRISLQTNYCFAHLQAKERQIFITKQFSSVAINNDEVLCNVFSEENKKKALNFVKQRGNFKVSPLLRRAAVLVPLCYNEKGEPSILYTLRSTKLNSYKGEISFPGGSSDPADGLELGQSQDIATALRETEEELGLHKDQIEVWGAMSPVPTSVKRVTSVLGFIRNPLKLRINSEEVQLAFTISLEHLCDPINWAQTRIKNSVDLPVYKNLSVSAESVAKDNREIELWGISAVITHLALEAFPSTFYTREVPFLKNSPTYSDLGGAFLRNGKPHQPAINS